jgi:hypothetical protein
MYNERTLLVKKQAVFRAVKFGGKSYFFHIKISTTARGVVDARATKLSQLLSYECIFQVPRRQSLCTVRAKTAQFAP